MLIKVNDNEQNYKKEKEVTFSVSYRERWF